MFAEQQEQVWVNAMEKKDNSNFEIIEIKINPYAYVVDSGIEDVNEDFVINNRTYHVFRKRIQNNVLQLYCLKNSHNAALSKDLKNIVDSQLFDADSNKENPGKKLMKSFMQDYIPGSPIIFISSSVKLVSAVTLNLYSPQQNILSGYFTANYPPPDMV